MLRLNTTSFGPDVLEFKVSLRRITAIVMQSKTPPTQTSAWRVRSESSVRRFPDATKSRLLSLLHTLPKSANEVLAPRKAEGNLSPRSRRGDLVSARSRRRQTNHA